ncbi:MAG TPA: DUF1576 domain-containing protein [Bacillota bacterium]|nr:DUF1576 domain-containing protein [Bacillota bacterium]
MKANKHRLILLAYLAALVVAGLFWPGGELLPEWRRIITAPSVLITDYFALAGPRAALINAGVVGMLGLGLLTLLGTQISGGAIAAVFIMTGFAMFGKTPLNVLPIFLGVYLFSLAKQGRFQSYVLVAMFGTALGPLVSHIMFGLGVHWVWGLLAGVAVGFILPALAPHLLHNHQGYNLYNVGFAAGIVGMFALALLKSFGYSASPVLYWSTEYGTALFVFFLFYFASMIALGLATGGNLTKLKRLMALPGAMVTDFTIQIDYATTYLNMGLLGMIGLAYCYLVAGTLNGPLLGGVLTMVGFAAFGKHPRNALPVMLGVYLATFVQVVAPADPGPMLAALFGTSLSPLAGAFGPLVGLVAGFLHLSVVSHIGVMHGGMNLYNNGLAAGFVATLIVVMIRALTEKR